MSQTYSLVIITCNGLIKVALFWNTEACNVLGTAWLCSFCEIKDFESSTNTKRSLNLAALRK